MLSEFAKSKWTPESVTSGPERDGTWGRTWMISARLREPFWGGEGMRAETKCLAKAIRGDSRREMKTNRPPAF